MCKMLACETGVNSNGFCNRHRLQWKKGYLSDEGRRLVPIKERNRTVGKYPKGAKCKMADCGGRARKNYLCEAHYDQYLHGIIDLEGNVLRPIKPARESYVNNNGYRLIRVHPDKKGSAAYVLEHRWVMEQELGRLLAPEESVHHKDGNKLNNSPENLELRTTRSHGEGHEWTAEEVINGMSALRHQDPKSYRMVLAELGLTTEGE